MCLSHSPLHFAREPWNVTHSSGQIPAPVRVHPASLYFPCSSNNATLWPEDWWWCTQHLLMSTSGHMGLAPPLCSQLPNHSKGKLKMLQMLNFARAVIALCSHGMYYNITKREERLPVRISLKVWSALRKHGFTPTYGICCFRI